MNPRRPSAARSNASPEQRPASCAEAPGSGNREAGRVRWCLTARPVASCGHPKLPTTCRLPVTLPPCSARHPRLSSGDPIQLSARSVLGAAARSRPRSNGVACRSESGSPLGGGDDAECGAGWVLPNGELVSCHRNS